MKSGGKRAVFLGLLAAGLGFSLGACSLKAFFSGAPETRTEELSDCIRDRGCRRTFIVAHRGNGFDAPENSREAVQKAAKAGVEVMETDLRLSKDGVIYILHDEELETSTNLTGLVADFSSRELSGAVLKNGESLPRFEELYSLSRGKIILDLDLKSDVLERVADWIAQNGSFDDVIFFVNTDDLMRRAAGLKKKYPSILIMPRVYGFYDYEPVEKIFGRLPEVVHTEFPTPEIVQKMHSMGVKVFANVLEDELEGRDREELGRLILDAGTDFIQTDWPLWLRELQ